MAKALLVVLTHPVEGREDEYNDWYTNDHLDDVLKAVDADQREQAEKLLLETANTPAMPLSGTLGPAITWWFEAISDRVEAAQTAA